MPDRRRVAKLLKKKCAPRVKFKKAIYWDKNNNKNKKIYKYYPKCNLGNIFEIYKQYIWNLIANLNIKTKHIQNALYYKRQIVINNLHILRKRKNKKNNQQHKI